MSPRQMWPGNWTMDDEDSLYSDPVLMEKSLKLSPISQVAEKIRENIAGEINKGIQVLLHKKMEYIRPKKNKTTTTRRPSFTSTTPIPHKPTITFQANSLRPQYNTISIWTPTTQRPTSHLSTYSNWGLTTHHPDDNIPTTSLRPISQSTNPTPQPAKRKAGSDSKITTVGQGFHILHNTILDISPFNLGPLETGHKRTWQSSYYTTNAEFYRDVQFINDNYCISVFSNQYNSTNEYNFKRIKNSTGLFEDPAEKVLGSRKLRQGNYINKQGSFFVQAKVGTYLLTPEHAELNVASAFINDIQNLPHLSGAHAECETKTAWVEFFNEYGTHYVESVSVGRSYELQYFDKYTDDKYDQIILDRWGPVDKKGCRNGTEADRKWLFKDPYSVLRSDDSLHLNFIGNLFKNRHTDFNTRINWAYRKLIRGELECDESDN